MLGSDSRKKLVGIKMLHTSLENVHFIEKALSDLANIALIRRMAGETDSNATDEERKDVRDHLKYILHYANKLEMTDIVHLIDVVFRPRVDANEPLTADSILSMRERINDSLQGVLASYGCLLLNKKESEYFENGGKDWEAVTTKWGALEYDIKEAGKCLSIERSTAAVFHLMRILEKGGQLLLQDLGLAQYNGKAIEDLVMKEALEALRKEIELLENPQNGQKKDKDRIQKLSEAHALIFTCKEAWRNPVMHPGSTWTPEEALDIHSSTRKFMNFLASII